MAENTANNLDDGDATENAKTAEKAAQEEPNNGIDSMTAEPEKSPIKSPESPAPNYELTPRIAATVKCSLCSNYLSLPPIYIISEDGSKYKCGRCIVRTHFNIRALMYENLAKYMSFPCIYQDCGEMLPWKDVKMHEKKCKYRRLMCVSSHCEEIVLASEFLTHYKQKHPKTYFAENLSVNNIHNSYGLCVLEHEGEIYIVSYDYDHFRFAVEVANFTNVNKKQFELKLSSAGSNYSISIDEQNISLFNERVHCLKCLKGYCKNESHVFAFHKKGITKHMSTKIEKDIVRKTFGSKDVLCTFKIVDQKPSKSEDDFDLNEILQGKEMIIDEVNDEEDEMDGGGTEDKKRDESKVDIVDELMKCPICVSPMIPPIHECLKGHTFCGECKSKHEKCPTCEATIESTRNYVLEGLAATLKLSNHSTLDSSDSTKLSLDKEVTCPLSKCFDKIKLANISSHFQEKHLNNFHFGKFSVKNIYAYYNVDVLVKNDKTYIVLFDFDDTNFGISACSLGIDDNHKYEVKLSSSDGKYSVTAVNQRIIPFNEKEHCFKCSLGTCKDIEHTYRKKRKEVFRRLTTKINRDSVRRMFASNKMNYTIRIVPKKNSSWKDKVLRQLFECPTCSGFMSPPIHQCPWGHTICSPCKNKQEDKCPTCEGKIEETRNLALEAVADQVELPCQYEGENCAFRAGLKRMASHEAECPLKKPCIEKSDCKKKLDE